ncbi:replicative DNA helicase [Streptomyces taklimakanensis]|uniref:replicative DNA helicase n=1 Tax=Streptomyces taklimakanensis TaxID=2569853 RepID=UPI0030842D45
MTTVLPLHTPAPADETTGAFDRTPPHDLHAEQAVLGAMILSAAARADVAGLDPNAFYYPHHTVLFRVLCEMDAAGDPIDPPLVAAHLTRRGLLREATGDRGPGYLHDLVREVPAAAHAAYYADSVREKAAWRSLIEAGTRAVQSGHLAEGDPSEAIGAAVRDLTHAAEGALPADVERKTAADLFAPLLDRVQATQDGTLPTGIPTGFADLDALTRGLMPKQFIVVAGRPAMGKSVLGMDFARAAARTGRRVAVFSLEMGADELVMRLASAEAKVALHHLKSGQMTDDDWLRIERHAPSIATDRIVIIDDDCSTLQQIRAHCLALKRDGGLDEVIIDYLQLMQAGGRRPDSRQQEVSEISRNLKLLAKELDVPIVALSQLNRGPEQRQDKKPMVSDLRESGSIEQDADMVILLHREDAYDKESPRAGEADLFVAKHRNGPTATITVAFQGHYARFVDMAQT